MSRTRYRVLAVDVAEQHESERVYRVHLKQAEQAASEPRYVLYVSTRRAQGERSDPPHDVGGVLELDPRLVSEERESQA